MSNLPTGTVTFLFTDIAGSTRLWQEQPEAMTVSHARHDAILREAIESNHGYVFQIVGDSFSAAFHNAIDGLNAALQAQRFLARMNDEGEKMNEGSDSSFTPALAPGASVAHPSSLALKVRMGLHTGAAKILADGKYEGYATLASTQRVMSVAHGGQVLFSHITYDLLQNNLPKVITLRDMGEHRLKDLRSPIRLYQLVAPDLMQDFPPIKSLNQFPNNLPQQLTSFIGREKEIDEIKTALTPNPLSSPQGAPVGRGESARLVTLTGSGGTGKTRLSQEVGAQLLANFEHGVWFIELAPLSDEAQIIPALAQVFGLQESPFNSLTNLVRDYLRDKKLLLILDNCEHLIAACARLADDLLHQCAGLKILASSREALGIAGEAAYRIPSLADSEATQLFVDRARAANSKFSFTDANASAISQICHRLDGIPLAIELAAARTKLLSAEQIATRLDDMFRLLVGGSRTALPRQQTLRALIDWSYDLLSDEEKHLLQFASVFVGGWTLDALEFVADEPRTIELLEQLVNKSLVVTEEHESEMRYFMLETIRQYAREKLFGAKQAEAARDRHFIHYKNLLEGLWDILRFINETELKRLKTMQVEVENLRAAFEWGLQNHAQDALDLASNMAMSMSMLGSLLLEGITMLNLAIEKFRALPPAEGGDANRLRKEIYARGCFSLGNLFQGTSEAMSARRALQEAIAIARELGDKKLLGLSLGFYANVSVFIRADDTVAAAKEGLEIFREIDHSGGMAMAYNCLALWEAMHGNFQEAEKYLALLQANMKDGTISVQSGFFNMSMGIGARYQGRFDLAQRFFEDGLRVFKQIGHKGMTTMATSEIAHTQRAMGNFAEAKKAYQETIKVLQDHGNRPAVAHQLECFAMIAVAEEEPQRAAKLFGAAEAIRELTGHKRSDVEEMEEAQFMSRLRSMLAEAEFNTLWDEGRSMGMEGAVQLALS